MARLLENLIWRCNQQNRCSTAAKKKACQMRKIAVTPDSGDNMNGLGAAQDFIDWANTASPGAKNHSTFVLFASQNEFVSYIESSAYGISPTTIVFSSAIVFSGGYPTWQYDLRLNR